MTPVISASNFTKRFRRVLAVDGLDLEVERGEVFGFLGPNGAGKSTTLRMMVGLVRPTCGSVRLFGHDVWREHCAALRNVGAMIEAPASYKYLSGRDNLRVLYKAYRRQFRRTEQSAAGTGCGRIGAGPAPTIARGAVSDAHTDAIDLGMCFGAESRPKHIPAIEMKMTLYYKRPDKVHIEAEQGVAMFPRGSLFGNPLEGFGRYQTMDGKYYLPIQMNAELHQQAGPDAGRVINSTIRFSNHRINKGISDKVFESNLSTPDRGPHLGRRYRK